MADVAVRPIMKSPEVPDPFAWPLAQKLAFRFFFCYWLKYALPESGRVSFLRIFGGVFPKATGFLIDHYEKVWHTLVPWVATRLFHVTGQPATYFRTGSGDTTLQYVNQLLYVLVAIAAVAVWTAFDRKRPNYRRLSAWLRLVVRYTLALTLFSYGFAKVFPLQFQPPRFAKLMEPYGEFTPMGVLWSFMGASLPYTIYSGAAEVLGGLLLLFRRTTTLGAIVSAAVMCNVMALNYMYDVPVKLYSTNLFCMAVFLLAPEARRLTDVLILNRAAAPSDVAQVDFTRRWARIAARSLWVLFVGFVLYRQVHGGWQGYVQTYRNVEHPPLGGLYDVESGTPWRKVAVDFAQSMTVRTTEDVVQSIPTAYDGNSITFNKRDKLTITRPDADHVVLQGALNGALATIRLKKIDTSKMALFSRGFHWINESPLNR